MEASSQNAWLILEEYQGPIACKQLLIGTSYMMMSSRLFGVVALGHVLLNGVQNNSKYAETIVFLARKPHGQKYVLVPMSLDDQALCLAAMIQDRVHVCYA